MSTIKFLQNWLAIIVSITILSGSLISLGQYKGKIKENVEDIKEHEIEYDTKFESVNSDLIKIKEDTAEMKALTEANSRYLELLLKYQLGKNEANKAIARIETEIKDNFKKLGIND